MKVSVTIITKNEEKNIKKCIESVQFADEIILVDCGSIDRTISIAQQFGEKVKIFQKKWMGYAAQKNFALSQTKNDWVLSLDADEQITSFLAQEIQKRLKLDVGNFDGYYIPRKNYFLGRWIVHCGWYPDYQLRLFLKNKAHFNDKAVHEKVIPPPKTDKLKNSLEHYSYQNLGEYFSRLNDYTNLQSKAKEDNSLYRIFFVLGIKPIHRFFYMYFFKLGILDGWRGFLLSVLSGYYELLVFIKVIRLKIKG